VISKIILIKYSRSHLVCGH